MRRHHDQGLLLRLPTALSLFQTNKIRFVYLYSALEPVPARSHHRPAQFMLILGGGEESTDLYMGSFQVARVVHDLYYKTNLKSIKVGNTSPISVSAPIKASGNVSNSVIDSGTNSLLLDQSLFDALAKKLSLATDSTLADAMQAGYVPMSKLNLSNWPMITLVLEGALGADVKLEVAPDTYWQTNAAKADMRWPSCLGMAVKEAVSRSLACRC